MKRPPLIHALLGCACLAASPLYAASVSSEWNLFDAGTYAWGNNSNWTSTTWASSAWQPTTATAPQNGANSFAARIRNAGANNITVETAGNLTISRFWLERTGTGSTTLKLGGDLTVTGVLAGPPTSGENARPTGFYNSVAGTPSGLVVDLNGHTFNAGSVTDTALQTSRNYTLRDTSGLGNGTFIISTSSNSAGLIGGTVYVENKVTVKTTQFGGGFQDGTGSLTNPGWVFARDATLWLSANGSGSRANLNVGGSIFGNIIVGSEGNTIAASYGLTHSNGTSLTILGDLTYHAGSVISMSTAAGAGSTRSIFLSGNLTDEATVGEDYGGRTDRTDVGFYFSGGADRVQEVLVKRQGLTTRFVVGSKENTPGNIRLLHGLTTTGPVEVLENSRVDANTFTLRAGSISVQNDARFAFTFGEGVENALIHATGQLSLGVFDLELNYNDAGWTDGDDLLLFRYGSLSGTAELGEVSLSGFTYNDLWNDGAGGIWLRDIVAVPEPGLAVPFLIAFGVQMLRRRRKQEG